MSFRFLVLIAGLLTVSFLTLQAHSADENTPKPVVVGVIDSPADLQHPMLAPYVLTDSSTVDGQDNPLTKMQNLNAQMLEEKIKKFAPENSQAVVKEFLSELGLSDSLPNEPGILKRLGSTLNKFNPVAYVRNLVKGVKDNLSGKTARVQSFAYLLHGTHVSSIAVNGRDPQNFKLIHIPFDTDMLNPVQGVTAEQQAVRIGKWLDSVTQVLQMYDVKVVNLSSGIFSSPGYEVYKKAAATVKKLPSSMMKTVGAEIERQMVSFEQGCKLSSLEYKRFFEQNSNVVFVMAGGNSNAATENVPEWDLTRLNLPNLIQVAATNLKGEITSFSNKSAQSIEIAAPGKDIYGAQLLGNAVRMSGTSMAAPTVAREIGLIRQAHPQTSAADAINLLYSEHSVSLKGLTKFVIDGRFLLPPGVSSPQTEQMIQNLSEKDWYVTCTDLFGQAQAK